MEKIISSSEDDREFIFNFFELELEKVFKNEIERSLFFLALIEAVNNAAEHGNKNACDKKIKINYFFRKEFALVSVEDEGEGFEPVFPDLKNVNKPRGRGLGFIKANTDIVFFNQNANKIMFMKGGEMISTFENVEAIVTIFPNKSALISELKTKESRKSALSQGIMEIFEFCQNKAEVLCFDLRHISLLNSLAWGAFFAEAEKDTIKSINLFNANKAIQTTSKQMGIGTRNDVYDKIIISSDNKIIKDITNRPGVATK